MAYHPLKSKLFAFFLIAWDIHRFFLSSRPTIFPLFIFFTLKFISLSDGDVRHYIIVPCVSQVTQVLWHFIETYLHIYIFFLIVKQI